MKLINVGSSDPQQPGESNVWIFVTGVVLLAFGQMAMVVLISLRLPNGDHAILALRSIVEPLMLALLASATYQYHASVNSRQTEWMRVASELARLKGMQDQRAMTDAEGFARRSGPATT